MKEIELLLREAFNTGFKSALGPAEYDQFEKWFASVDLKAWLVSGSICSEHEVNSGI